MLNSGVIGFCFDSKLRKCSEDLFFGHHEGKLETFAKICVAMSLETLHEDPTVRALQKSATNRLFGNYSAKSLEPPLLALGVQDCVSVSAMKPQAGSFLSD